MAYVIVTQYKRSATARPIVNVYGSPDWTRNKATYERIKTFRENRGMRVDGDELLVHVRKVCDIEAMNREKGEAK